MTSLFPGPALAAVGIILTIVRYVNEDGFAQSSIELGLPHNALSAAVSVQAILFSCIGIFIMCRRRKR